MSCPLQVDSDIWDDEGEGGASGGSKGRTRLRPEDVLPPVPAEAAPGAQQQAPGNAKVGRK